MISIELSTSAQSEMVDITARVSRALEEAGVRADGVVAARLGLEESTPLVHLERLRLADAEPLAVDRVWLPERLAAPLLDVIAWGGGDDFAWFEAPPEASRTAGLRLLERLGAVAAGRLTPLGRRMQAIPVIHGWRAS